jgi:hypothetical protein
VQLSLAGEGKHRAPSIPDVIIAAPAELVGLTALQMDKDFDLIADLTGQVVTGSAHRCRRVERAPTCAEDRGGCQAYGHATSSTRRPRAAQTPPRRCAPERRVVDLSSNSRERDHRDDGGEVA